MRTQRLAISRSLRRNSLCCDFRGIVVDGTAGTEIVLNVGLCYAGDFEPPGTVDAAPRNSRDEAISPQSASRLAPRALGMLILLAGVLLVSQTAAAFQTMYNCRSAWHPNDLPVTYRVNQTPPSSIPDIDQIRSIFVDSFAAWGTPCCSSFTATDGGLTTATGEQNRDSQWTLSFLENSWPSSLGDARSTLGVTLTVVDGGCNIVGSDIVFNAYSWTFIDGSPNRFDQADLQSIATHEIGHFIGLGHTNVQDATMYPAYIGGTLARSLHSDDVDGACYLYEQACNCTASNQCNVNQDCIDGVCQIPPCSGDQDCDVGLTCDLASGDCVVPPCTSAADCTANHRCEAGVCVPDADCAICGQCQANADCGANGICIPAGYIGEASACTSWCNSSADCPGNSECFEVPTQDGNVFLCFNNDADVAGPCPGDYVCQDDGGGGGGDLCAGVTCTDGAVCNPSTGTCQGGGGGVCSVCDGCSGQTDGECGANGACLAFIGGPQICSLPCGADGSCPGNSTCFQLSDEAGATENWCLNETAETAGICAGGWSCEVETPNLCEGVTCNDGVTCNPNTGLCEGGGGGGGDSSPDVGFGDVNPPGPDVGVTPGGNDGDDDGGVGCACSSSDADVSAAPLWLLALLGLTIRRRRR